MITKATAAVSALTGTVDVTGTLSDSTGNVTIGDSLDVSGDLAVTGSVTSGANAAAFWGTNAAAATEFRSSNAAATGVVPIFKFANEASMDANDLFISMIEGFGPTTIWKIDKEGDVTQAGNLAFAGTGTNTITSDTTAANATATVGAFTLKPTAALAAADCVLDVQDSGGNHMMRVDAQGQILSTYLNASTSIETALIYLDSNGGIVGNFNNGYVALKAGSNVPTSVASFQTNVGGEVASVGIGGFYLQPVQTVTTGGSYTLTPTSNYVQVNPSSNATITLGESGVVDGTVVRIVNIHATNTAAFADTSTVSELTAGMTLGQYDTLTIMYVVDRWVELARSNN